MHEFITHEAIKFLSHSVQECIIILLYVTVEPPLSKHLCVTSILKCSDM